MGPTYLRVGGPVDHKQYTYKVIDTRRAGARRVNRYSLKLETG